MAGWQRNVQRGSTFSVNALNGPDNTGFFSGINGAAFGTGNVNVQNQYVNPWLLMGSLFIPVIPTNSANLAGTASILTNVWVGQGVEAFGFTGNGGNMLKLNNNAFGLLNYEAELLKKFGGFVEGQYYFSNQWFLNAVYAFSKAFSRVPRSLWNLPGCRWCPLCQWLEWHGVGL